MISSFSFVALKHRNFRLIWLGLLLSVTGSMMQNAGLLWHVSLLVPDNRGLALGSWGWRAWCRRGMVLLWAVGAYGLATIVFGLSRSFWLTFVCLAMTGPDKMSGAKRCCP